MNSISTTFKFCMLRLLARIFAVNVTCKTRLDYQPRDAGISTSSIFFVPYGPMTTDRGTVSLSCSGLHKQSIDAALHFGLRVCRISSAEQFNVITTVSRQKPPTETIQSNVVGPNLSMTERLRAKTWKNSSVSSFLPDHLLLCQNVQIPNQCCPKTPIPYKCYDANISVMSASLSYKTTSSAVKSRCVLSPSSSCKSRVV